MNFIGLSNVLALKMNREEYNKYRGWTVPADENPKDEGYLVKHGNGHENWFPTKIFEAEYAPLVGGTLVSTILDMTSGDYKARFRAEYRQLTYRMEGLSKMLENYKAGKLSFKPKCSYELLQSQYNAMSNYESILRHRAEIEGIAL